MKFTLLTALVASLAGGCGASTPPTTPTPRPTGGLKDQATFDTGPQKPATVPKVSE